MIDSAQTILFVVIIVLAVLFSVLGWQVFFILRDLRKTVDKANKVLDNTSVITQSVSAPISSLSSLVMGIKTGSSFINLFKKIISRDENTLEKKRKDADGKQ